MAYDLELAKFLINVVAHFHSIYLGCILVVCGAILLLIFIIYLIIKIKLQKKILVISIFLICFLLIPVVYWFSNESFYARKEIRTTIITLLGSLNTKDDIELFLQLEGAKNLEKKFRVFLTEKEYTCYINRKLGLTNINSNPNEIIINTKDMTTNMLIEITHDTNNNTIVTVTSNDMNIK